jgi:hypothetical protein
MVLVNDDDDDDERNSRFMGQMQNIYCYRDTSGTFVRTELIG